MQTPPPEPTYRAARAVIVPDILDVADLARWLRCGPSAARAHLRAGRIPGRRIGRRWLVTRDALLRALSASPPPGGHRPFVIPGEGDDPDQ